MKSLETDVKINLETAFFFFSSQGSENVPLCAIVLVLDIFSFQSDVISQLQRLTFFTVPVQKFHSL